MAKIKVSDGMIFERYEKKYRISEDTYKLLSDRLSEYMTPDKYGQYTICSLYLDNDNFDLIRKSMEKPNYKEKIRLRSYGVPSESSKVYLELKKKLDGITYKRRVSLPYGEALRYIENRTTEFDSGQIFNEITYFLERYKPSPKVLLFYDRTAFFGIEDKNLRITFDNNIRYRNTDPYPHNDGFSIPIITPDEYIMEIKVPGAFPIWLSKLLSELGIYPTSFSKYATAYTHILTKESVYVK